MVGARLLAGLVVLALSSVGALAEPLPARIGGFTRDAEVLTSRPVNYESHWYAQSGLDLRFNNPEAYQQWLDLLRRYPPEIYHGEVAPLAWGIGPAEPRPGAAIDYYKFDPEAGHYWLSAEQWRQRLDETRAHLQAMHDAGVEKVLCYTCFSSVGGNHVRRTGLWEFWDRWDEFAEMLDLPERPHEPTEWLRVWDPAWGPNQANLPAELLPFSFSYFPVKETYAPQWRYGTCPNTPGWLVWHELLARWAARAGYTGFFWDNYIQRRCACEWCQQGFRDYLAEKYRPEELRALFGTDDLAQIRLSHGSKTMTDPLADESSRFWFSSQARALAQLEANIADEAPNWESAVNWIFSYYSLNAIPPAEHVLTEHCFLDEFRTARVDWGYQPGLYLPRGVEIGHSLTVTPTEPLPVTNVLTYSIRHATRFPGQTHWLIAPTANRDVYPPTPDTVRLSLAECAAFGGGAGVDAVQSHYIRHTGRFAELNPESWLQARQDFFGFVRAHEDLFAGYRQAGEVGLFFPTENRGVPEQSIALSYLYDYLLEAGVPTVFLTDNLIHPANLDRLRALIVHGHRLLADEEVAELERFMRAGGTVIASGPLGEFDLIWRPRARSEAQPWLPAPGAAQTLAVGAGRFVYLGPEAPGREALLGAVADALGHAPSCLARPVDAEAAILRLKLWEAADGSGRVLHLLNYRVPFGAQEPTPVAPCTVAISLRLPDAGAVTAVEAIAPEPGAQFAALPFEVRAGRVEFTVPDLTIYRVLRIR